MDDELVTFFFLLGKFIENIVLGYSMLNSNVF